MQPWRAKDKASFKVDLKGAHVTKTLVRSQINRRALINPIINNKGNMEFSLSTLYSGFDVQKDYEVDNSNIDEKLSHATHALANSWEAIHHNNELLEELMEMAHGFQQLDAKHKKQVNYLISSSLANASRQCKIMIEEGDYVDMLDVLKLCLEKYGYLMFVLLNFLSRENFPTSTSARQKQTSVLWKNNCQQVDDSLASVVPCLQLDLSKIFVTTPEKNQLLDLFLRPVFHLMELPERMKVNTIRILMFRIISLAVTRHGSEETVQNSVIQSLTYYPHLPQYMAELLHTLEKAFDLIKLSEDILLEISQLEFNANDTNGPKAVSEFLVRVSELSPRLIMRQMASISQILDNTNQSLRCSVIETCGNIVVDAFKTLYNSNSSSEDERAEISMKLIGKLFSLLKQRTLDQNPFARTKALQAMVKVFNHSPVKDYVVSALETPESKDLDIGPANEWYQEVMDVAITGLYDRSTLVRRNAIKLLSKILIEHPFTSQESFRMLYSRWERKLDDLKAASQHVVPERYFQKFMNQNENSETEDPTSKSSEEDAMDVDNEEARAEGEAGNEGDEGDEGDNAAANDDILASEQALAENDEDFDKVKSLMKLWEYHNCALAFIKKLERGVAITSSLLFSKNRNEVLEAMDFLVCADAYGVENASEGIRKMLHLVWMKGSSDEGKSIASQLVECYKLLFLTTPSDITAQQAAEMKARNLIKITINATVADLASLEKLMCMIYEGKLIDWAMIELLWFIYSKAGSDDTRYSQAQIHGAIIVLGMVSSANPAIVQCGLKSLLEIGLGSVGRLDLVLCKHSCATLLKIVQPLKKRQTQNMFSEDSEAAERLKAILLCYTLQRDWFPVAEQAIDAIFRIITNPIVLCDAVIKSKTKDVFISEKDDESRTASLAQLLFIVGHVAIKTIEHLEKLEAQFKKMKHDLEAEKSNQRKENAAESELEMIGGTSEDDFADVVVYIRETEILFGEKSLLAKFGSLVTEICLNRKAYDNGILQRSAVLCLSKLMCVSSKFCEANLPLFITIMEKSEDPVIRSNCVLGLGDMAVCFNNLVDENTDFLYRRLTDDHLMVQRTCLMTVTFLILAGQVKVKGQLSSMAKCLENPDQGISDMCRLFFTELATKDNAIYNAFIDIFSGLSNDDSLSKEAMKRIIKFLVLYIDKEKHQKQLSEKLLVRLMKSETEKQWNDVAFVLTTIPYKNDSITQALEAGYKMASAREA